MLQRTADVRASTPILHDEDLIDDREVVSVDQDRLAHDGIVDQLVALATSVATPSNIALYGPWGSGKSGIANLLRDALAGASGVRFVRFDAFKYADVPLRRNFISAIASGLGRRESKYHADLYSGRTKTDITVPPLQLVRLLLVFAGVMACLALVMSIGLAVVALLQEPAFWVTFRSLAKQALLAGLVPATLLAALVSLASKTFNVERSLAKPESDEQFEQLFRELVAATGADRLVVFVDELDRCSASEVVATLDTVRTFLGIERCVFIIAADRNVLEEALTRAARQETPTNETNPYYSMGSAYLDKVFQYQVSLPPLLTQSVSSYARSLVADRGGVWGEINTEYVLSVLIPTHVSSPRRVKHLLNTFALTYRLAERRSRADLIARSARDTAPAIARLVCLRVEFPLFARHLELDARLPDLVLEVVRRPDAERPAGVPDRVHALARAYAVEGAAPATVLAGDQDDADEAETAERSTVRAHNKQLLNYLSRTRQVRGPDRDLIYLQTTGTVFGLDGELALVIEQSAEDGDVATLRRRIEGLDHPQRSGALKLLLQQIRDGDALTGPNAARSLLQLVGELPDLPVAEIVDAFAQEVCTIHDATGGVLNEDTVTSAWTLAKSGSEAAAAALRRRVIAAALDDPDLPRDFLFHDAAIAMQVSPERVVAFLGAEVVDADGASALGRLLTAHDEDVLITLRGARDQIVARVREALRMNAEWKAAQTAAAGASSRTTSAVVEDEPWHPRELLKQLAGAVRARETPIQHEVLRILLAVDDESARTAAMVVLGATQPVTDRQLVSGVLAATARRVVAEWPEWCAGVSGSAITTEHGERLTELVAKLPVASQLTESAAEAAITALRPLIAALPEERRPDVTAQLVSRVESLVSNPDEAREHSRRLALARKLADADLADYSQVAEVVVARIGDTLAQDLSPAENDDALTHYLFVDAVDAVRAAPAALVPEALSEIAKRAAHCGWLHEVSRIELPLVLASASPDPQEMAVALPPADTVAELVSNYGRRAVNAATLWAELGSPGADDLAVVLDRLLAEEVLTQDFVVVANRAQDGWTPGEHREFLERYLNDPAGPVPAPLTLGALGLENAADTGVAEILADRFERATNNAQRQAVVRLWTSARIQSSTARKRLLEVVVFGLLDLHATRGGNVGAVDLALDALDGPGSPLPHGVKTALGERLRATLHGNKALQRRAALVLTRLGYSATSGILGKAKRLVGR
jgi:hypothetical protein